MSDDELLESVRDLRSQGHTPKEIARVLGIRPARVTPLVRAAAAKRAAAGPDADLVGCWVSAGWSVGLTLKNGHAWPDRPSRVAATTGVVGVLVGREGRGGRGGVSVCGYLVDTYCLGVKNALGPRAMSRSQLRRFVGYFFEPFDGEPVDAPLELARHLVWGALDYARGLGFEPHPDFHPASGHLGPLEGPSAIGFGRHGKPSYMQGPFDDADRILRTLDERVGAGGYEFAVAVPT